MAIKLDKHGYTRDLDSNLYFKSVQGVKKFVEQALDFLEDCEREGIEDWRDYESLRQSDTEVQQQPRSSTSGSNVASQHVASTQDRTLIPTPSHNQSIRWRGFQSGWNTLAVQDEVEPTQALQAVSETRAYLEAMERQRQELLHSRSSTHEVPQIEGSPEEAPSPPQSGPA